MYETLEMEDEDFLEQQEDFLEMEDEDFLELEDEDFLELEDEDEQFLGDIFELEDEGLEMEDEDFLGDMLSGVLGGELEAPATELEQELASELLEVQSEDELEQFLGKLISGAAKGISNFAKSGVGKSLGGILKSVAKKALPVVGGALGSMVAPGIGTALGSKLGSMAGGLFEMEDELSHEELEFEVAKKIVRIAKTAAKHAARAAGTAPPHHVATRAVVKAARRHAPLALPAKVQPRYRARRPIVRPGVVRVVRPGARTVAGHRVRRPVGHRRGAVYAPYRGTARWRYGRIPSYGYAPSGARVAVRTAPRTVVRGRPVVAGAPVQRRRGTGARRYGTFTPSAGYGSTGWTDGDGYGSTGSWVRRGDRIIVLGV